MSSPPKVAGSGLLNRRLDAKGLRPRVAASVLAALWVIAILVFGLVIHLLDRETFDSFGDGAWWATQTVTTVGYGDIVPGDWLGKSIAMLLMIGGLSFFAVITGLITTEFVTRADAQRREERDHAIEGALGDLREEVAALRRQLGAISPEPEPPAAPPAPPAAG